MPVEILRRAAQVFGCPLIQLYGLTETSPLLTMMAPRYLAMAGEETPARRLASCGRAVPGVRVRVVNDQGNDVQPGEVGEIVARGPNIMQGYWNKPEETAAAFRHGWFCTGDLATVDEEQFIFMVDRKKDMIISGGENVYSTEVENALYQHPAVLEAAVIGVPDTRWGEAISTWWCSSRMPRLVTPTSSSIVAASSPITNAQGVWRFARNLSRKAARGKFSKRHCASRTGRGRTGGCTKGPAKGQG